MDLFDAEILAKQLMSNYIPHYRFAWSREKRTYGRCFYKTRTITLSAVLTPLCSEDAVRDTIMHEIAHALTPGAKHGKAWRLQMLKFGLRPDRCVKDDDIDTSHLETWKATCAYCGNTTGMMRKPRVERSCSKCNNKFDRKYLLTYVRI